MQKIEIGSQWQSINGFLKKLYRKMDSKSYNAFPAARDIDFKGYTNPCNKPNENTLPPPVGVSSYNHCCECNKKLK